MTNITGLGGLNMTSRLARGNAPVVATGATTDNGTVIDADHSLPAGGVMTGVTAVAGLDMGWCFTGSRGAVMAATATSRNCGVVNRRGRSPGTGPVAEFADIIGLNMGRTLTACSTAVVATEAGAGDGRMIHPGTQPGGGGMTAIAGLGCLDMGGGFSRGN
jgi:hypothetical protein